MKTTSTTNSQKPQLTKQNVMYVEILNNLFSDHKKPFLVGDLIIVKRIERIKEIVSNKRYYITSNNFDVFVTIKFTNNSLMIYDDCNKFKGILTEHLFTTLNIYETLSLQRDV